MNSTKITNYINNIISEHEEIKNDELAYQQSKYMKFNFEFYGIKSPQRTLIFNKIIKEKIEFSKEEVFEIVESLWQKDKRELHYFAMILLFRYKKLYKKNDIDFFEKLIIQNSWWDSIDFISPKIIAYHFQIYPELIEIYIDKWLNSSNIWLIRSAILFQLKYKEKLNVELLDAIIKNTKNTKEFFINKAIGWILREYSKTNPNWVRNYIANNTLTNLSRREAMKYL